MKGVDACGGRLLVAVLILLPLGVTRAGESGGDEPTPLTTFRAQVARLSQSWNELLRHTAPLRKRVEDLRLVCRHDERASQPTSAQRTWRARWDATSGDRLRLHNRIFPHFLKWTAPLQALFAAQEDRALTPQILAQVSGVAAGRLRAWLEVGEVGVLRGLLETAPGGIVRALALPGRPQPRRALLAAVAAREAATPGASDLDALRAVVSWAGLFVAGRKPAAQLELVSRDLVRVLTERKEDGLGLGDGRYYVAGRFGDRGFAVRYRDGSDQVRHFAWAFRMHAASKRPEATALLLRTKEVLDARSRKRVLNEADLALNAAARDLVATIRGGEEGAVPLDVSAWPQLFEERLADRVRTGR